MSPGSTRAAAHSVSPTLAQSNRFMVAPPGRAFRIAGTVQSGLLVDPFPAGVGLLSGVVADDEQAPSRPTLQIRSRVASILGPEVTIGWVMWGLSGCAAVVPALRV